MGISRRHILAGLGAGTVAAAIDLGRLRSPAIAVPRLGATALPLVAGTASPQR
ncbi:MAG: hypothetical protein QOE30_3156 [Mycobacterium sp.]|uniref:hypothetical protein n=1 Tax=Mycobacterium sp. TaxID=1785 RepID=UPI0028BA03DB|nr:hypothetical protein [Mycobacterium sp.]MDT5117417.1 hypothetical protein [Mycobacterium sp.]